MLYFNSKKNTNRNLFKFFAIRIFLMIALIFVVWFISKKISGKMGVNISNTNNNTISNTLSSKKDLLKKIENMQSVIDSYKARESLDLALQDENQKLKAELGRKTKNGGVLANVITDPQYSFYSTFLIDAGSVDNIKLDQTVYAFDGIALGVISKVGENKSTVSLFSQSGKETFGNTLGNNVAVTLIGRGSGEYEVRMPRDMHFEVGELISSQSVSTSILAKIEKIVTDPRDPFQRLLAKAPINLQNLKWVIVK